VILVDANILVFATTGEGHRTERARAWLAERLDGPGRVGLPWGTLLAFLRLVTDTRIFPHPVPLPEAWAQVDDWLQMPSVWVPEPTERHAEVLGALLVRETQSRLVPDAHLAALAIEHGLVLCSNDRDFSRFEGLRWQDPLR
jgi:toxin-antitoxin system PIN domain toxin